LDEIAKNELLGLWIDRALIEEATREGICEHCGTPVVCIKARPRYLGLLREIISCPNCGITKDIPLGAQVEVRFEPRKLELWRLPPSLSCQVHFAGWSYKKPLFSLPWPRDSRDRLEPVATIPVPPPLGPFVLLVFLAWDRQLACVARELSEPPLLVPPTILRGVSPSVIK
jgi:hypothetical protein